MVVLPQYKKELFSVVTQNEVDVGERVLLTATTPIPGFKLH